MPGLAILVLILTPNSTNLSRKTYQSLDPSQEHPGLGTIIAIDTEFVSVRQSEIEINSDGDRATIRPTVYALARVSVIRGPSPTFLSTLEPGTPFIDDYISTTEPIVDYLTSYSGIVAGDLDPRISPHNVVPLKHAYKKLWLLLNLGCTFLGHGLKQDFRVINIQVPKAQVIDTAESFFVAARLRKLSLAFLAWYLLKEDIQQETHDSIEDARTALKLHAKYLEFVDAGILDPMLAEIYRRGRDMGFKPPQRKEDHRRDDALVVQEVSETAATGPGVGTGTGTSAQAKKPATAPMTVSVPTPEPVPAVSPGPVIASQALESTPGKDTEESGVSQVASAGASARASPQK